MTVSTAPRWLLGEHRRSDAHRLYCFAPGGGSVTEFVGWAPHLPGVSVLGVQLPGRGSRLSEEPVTRMTDLVDEIVGQVRFRPPFTLFGHSLGALLSYEVALALRAAGCPEPDRLYVSGFPAPHLPRQSDGITALADRELVGEVGRRHGGLPPQVLTDENLLTVTARALRADYRALENYEWTARGRLDCAVNVLGGREDSIPETSLRAWQEHAAAPISLRLLPGGHYYFRQQRSILLRILAGGLGVRP